MKKINLLLALSVAACSTASIAQGEVNYSLNLKSWNNSFKDRRDTSNSTNSSVVSLTAKKDAFYLTASTILPTTYTFNNGKYLDRRDTDIAIGWMVNPNVSLLGGIKKASVDSYDYSGSNTSKTTSDYDINYIGVNGFKSVSERQFIFGTATRSLNASQSSNGTKTTGHTYTTLEAGFGHVLSNETQLTVAYRMQDLKFPDGGYAKLGGIIFGANFNF